MCISSKLSDQIFLRSAICWVQVHVSLTSCETQYPYFLLRTEIKWVWRVIKHNIIKFSYVLSHELYFKNEKNKDTREKYITWPKYSNIKTKITKTQLTTHELYFKNEKYKDTREKYITWPKCSHVKKYQQNTTSRSQNPF